MTSNTILQQINCKKERKRNTEDNPENLISNQLECQKEKQVKWNGKNDQRYLRRKLLKAKETHLISD